MSFVHHKEATQVAFSFTSSRFHTIQNDNVSYKHQQQQQQDNMTLTVVIGSSGSGKTTFLQDLYQKATTTARQSVPAQTTQEPTSIPNVVYVTQYHQLRPYIPVSKIPNFDPTPLPYWHIYQEEQRDGTIPIGGTLAGTFTAGLSGGQRKLLLLELISQRTVPSIINDDFKKYMILLDEPCCGVTEDFLPYCLERLQQLQLHHNVVVVTNDHVQALMDLADRVLIVSAVDRDLVQVRTKTSSAKIKLNFPVQQILW